MLILDSESRLNFVFVTDKTSKRDRCHLRIVSASCKSFLFLTVIANG